MADAEAGDHVIVGGAANIAGEEGFARRDTIRRVFQALDREAELRRLMQSAARAREVMVTIGRENPVRSMREASVVAAAYGAGDRPLGTIGILGPTRMAYPETITAVRAVARRLSDVVAALSA